VKNVGKTKIKIGPFEYDCTLVDSAFVSSVVIGECDFTNMQIRVEKSPPHDKKFQILIHEIMEAITDQNEIDLPHSQLQTISNALTQVLLDNDIHGIVKKWK
jgi:hypothetical protein